ncbi:hypothetical protein H0H81_001817 [Sphagnurus paluster]|uniref:Uncharacterized protein n=1 Tax=Sphagnurus paluster TaxID=117069 RepID=A0A9P7KKI5_9AGAR|nr:hypothetical protein H0H81_001817 [Sphagnurus paluster]
MLLPVSSLGVAIVTGAARGIGRGIALRLAKDGYDIGLNDLPTAAEPLDDVRKEIIALGRRPFIAFGDVSVPVDVEKTVSTVVENLGPLNVLTDALTHITHVDEVSDFQKQFSINTIGAFLSYKYAALQMIKQGKGGRIIGACSIAGKQGNVPYADKIRIQIIDLIYCQERPAQQDTARPNLLCGVLPRSQVSSRGETSVEARL